MKILILVSSSGGGHIAAGKNLERAFKSLNPKLEIEIIDSYDFIHPFKKWQYTKGWEFSTRYLSAPYRWSRNLAVNSPAAVARMKKGFKSAAKKLYQHLQENPAGIIVTTHPHAAGVVDLIKERHPGQKIHLSQIYTDYQFHAFYVQKNVDHYFTPAEWIAVELRKQAPRAKVTASGAPIHPCFAKKQDLSQLRQDFAIPDDGKPVILLSRGSFGWGVKKSVKIARLLATSGLPIHLVLHAGNSAELSTKFHKIATETNDSEPATRVLGWVHNMYDLLEMTDVYVGKPGGMQVAESFSQGTPLIVSDPMPGQEDANVEYIVGQKAGVLIKEPREVLEWVNSFVKDATLLNNYKERARLLGNPGATVSIAREVLADNKIRVDSADLQKNDC